MDPLPAHELARPRLVHPVRAVCGGLLLVLAGCGSTTPSLQPSAPSASVTVPRPAVQIDDTWQAVGGAWTFTGDLDPQLDPTDVVLDIGPGPATVRRFDTHVPVAADVTAAGPLTVTTREIPDIDEICVRFTASNAGGSTSSSPLCFPHDLPSIGPPTAPTVEIDERWMAGDGQWTFRGRIDPGRSATDVVLEIGGGPASAPKFETSRPVSSDLTDQATLTFSTADIPDAAMVCVRFSATNDVGTTSSDPLCFDPAGPPPS